MSCHSRTSCSYSVVLEHRGIPLHLRKQCIEKVMRRVNSRITVIIPFYNCPYVDQAIQSVLNQFSCNVEVIVVDDGSSLYLDKIGPYTSYIQYSRKANGGTASALNHGIRHAAGDYIAWLSSDDLYYPGKLQKQWQFMQDWQASASYTSFDNIDEANRITQHNMGIYFPNPLEFARAFLHYNPINGCTVMIKKEVFSNIGFFDESLPFTHDVDFWYRMLLNGYHFHYLGEPLTAYRVHSEMGTRKHQPALLEEYTRTKAKYQLPITHLLSSMAPHYQGAY